MKILQFLINLFKVNHAKKTATILDQFSAVRQDLEKVNLSASKKAARNIVKVTALQAESDELVKLVEKNKAVALNIGKLLGEE